MGEAKKRGTFEERQAQGIARRKADAIAGQRQRDVYLREYQRCRRDKELERPVVSRVGRSMRSHGSALHRFGLAAALAGRAAALAGLAAAEFNKAHRNE